MRQNSLSSRSVPPGAADSVAEDKPWRSEPQEPERHLQCNQTSGLRHARLGNVTERRDAHSPSTHCRVHRSAENSKENRRDEAAEHRDLHDSCDGIARKEQQAGDDRGGEGGQETAQGHEGSAANSKSSGNGMACSSAETRDARDKRDQG